MRIHLVCDPMIVNTEYRAYQPMRALSARGHEIQHDVDGDRQRFDARVARDADVVFIHRFVGDDVLQFVRDVQAHGTPVVWDNDDDILSVPRSSPRHREMLGLRGRNLRASIAAMVRVADLVTAPSRLLAGHFGSMGAAAVQVLENYVSDDHVRQDRRRKESTVTIGWLAGSEHQIDFQLLKLQQPLTELLARNTSLQLTTIGFALGIDSPRYRHIPQIRFAEIGDYLAQFDIGIAPLADIEFNRMRSNVKLKEYSAAGAAWVASPVGPYVGYGADEGGMLAEAGAWEMALEQLVTDPRRLRRLQKRAARWGRSQTVERNAQVWERCLLDVVRVRAGARAAG